MNRKWSIVNTKKYGYVILPNKSFKCPFCGETLVLHNFSAKKHQQFNAYHSDIGMKCPSCDWFTIFGVPISEGEFNKLNTSKLKSKIIRDELLDLQKDIDEVIIQNRLKQLGYY